MKLAMLQYWPNTVNTQNNIYTSKYIYILKNKNKLNKKIHVTLLASAQSDVIEVNYLYRQN